ncbi:MAG: hypothetical protein SGJ20_21740, partial [Planctomycetota bacterium]|nr:hypothetical protein [Planctomycetota bacterium]
VSMARIGRIPLFFKGVAQIAYRRSGTHLGNAGYRVYDATPVWANLGKGIGLQRREDDSGELCGVISG